jgi:hypothetical protein
MKYNCRSWQFVTHIPRLGRLGLLLLPFAKNTDLNSFAFSSSENKNKIIINKNI